MRLKKGNLYSNLVITLTFNGSGKPLNFSSHCEFYKRFTIRVEGQYYNSNRNRFMILSI